MSDAVSNFYWTALFPGLAIMLLVTGLTLLGEGLNDIVNPLLRVTRPHRPDRPPQRRGRARARRRRGRRPRPGGRAMTALP